MRLDVPEPGAIYTVGLNYDGAGAAPRPERPLIYGKSASAVVGDGATIAWDRALTANVDAEVELGVVIGTLAWNVAPDEAAAHVFGYTIVNDVSSRDPWLDGDQWLLGKSMPGFCPVGPVVVTARRARPRATSASAARSTASRSRTAGRRRCASRSPRSSRSSAATSSSAPAT